MEVVSNSLYSLSKMRSLSEKKIIITRRGFQAAATGLYLKVRQKLSNYRRGRETKKTRFHPLADIFCRVRLSRSCFGSEVASFDYSFLYFFHFCIFHFSFSILSVRKRGESGENFR